MMKLNGIPERFQKCSFENFQGNSKAVKGCQKHDMRKSLYIVGGAGRGKTHLIAAQARELVKAQNYNFYFISAARLFDLLAGAAFNHDDREGTEYEILKRCTNVGILFLDDLGQHGASKWIISKLYLIIDQRYSNDRPTIVTSNYGLKEIQSRLGEPISSRLSESRIVRLNGADYRAKR